VVTFYRIPSAPAVLSATQMGKGRRYEDSRQSHKVFSGGICKKCKGKGRVEHYVKADEFDQPWPRYHARGHWETVTCTKCQGRGNI
jgi:DnaJ-class molecular chaperone